MAGYIPSTSSVPVQESRHTFYADASILSKHVGHACTLVVGGTEPIVKLAVAGDIVFGQISTVEIPKNGNQRTVAMVTIMGGFRLACKPNEVFTIGDTVVGGANGLVVKGTASLDQRFVVTDLAVLAEGAVGVLKL